MSYGIERPTGVYGCPSDEGVMTVFVAIKHKVETFKSENYKLFTQEEFIDMVEVTSREVGLIFSPEICFYQEGPSGSCLARRLQNKVHIVLAFHNEVLNGEKYTIAQIKEIIRHELSHAIAFLRFDDDCGHDERWQQVALEVGCDPSETLPFIYSLGIHVDTIEASTRKHNYYLLCSKCRAIHLEIDDNPIQFFMLSGTELPICLGDLGTRSPCCNSLYILEAEIYTLLDDLVKGQMLPELIDILELHLSRYK